MSGNFSTSNVGATTIAALTLDDHMLITNVSSVGYLRDRAAGTAGFTGFEFWVVLAHGSSIAYKSARGGQPLTTVPYEVAQGQEGVVFEETEDAFCKGGSCGA